MQFKPNQRTSYRVPAIGQRYGRLKICGQERLVLILDESASGFGILMGGKFDGPLNVTVLLQSGAGWVEARIGNIASVQTSNMAGAEIETPCTRLGLVRIRDLPVRPTATSPFLALLQIAKRPLLPFHNLWHVPLVCVAMVVCGGLLLVLAIELPGNLFDYREVRSAWRAWVTPPHQVDRSASVSSATLIDKLAPFTQPEALMRPQAIEYLRLNESQLDRLRLIGKSANSAAGRKQALQVLTREQLVRWHDLTLSPANITRR